jgi:pilus assembly protein CpaF
MQELKELKRILELPGLNDLVINGPKHAQADFGSGLEQIDNPFLTADSLRVAMVELALEAGARLDIAKPISDFSLLGARFHAVLPSAVSPNALLSVRKHASSAVSLDHLVQVQMLSESQALWLKEQLRLGSTMLISGATSSGKTTLLRALLLELDERVIAIEQTPELFLAPPAITLTERIANQEGAGAIELDELVVHALRMRPDRIVVGEVRSKEFRVLLQAINNGHRGTMATLHASSCSMVAERALVLGLIAGMPEALTARLVASSIDFVIQLSKLGDRRYMSAVGIPHLVSGNLVITEIGVL